MLAHRPEIRLSGAQGWDGFPTPSAQGETSDIFFVAEAAPQAIAHWLVDLVRNRLPRAFVVDPTRDIQAQCPMIRGVTGARSLNDALQQPLNPPAEANVNKFGCRLLSGRVRNVRPDQSRVARVVGAGARSDVPIAPMEVTGPEFEARPPSVPFQSPRETRVRLSSTACRMASMPSTTLNSAMMGNSGCRRAMYCRNSATSRRFW